MIPKFIDTIELPCRSVINGVNFGGEIHCLLQKLYLHWLTVLMELNKLVLSPRPAALPRVIIG